VQCFAKHQSAPKSRAGSPEPLLQQFEYLSTVSGGGYLGSWLSAWLCQARNGAPTGSANAVVRSLNSRVDDHAEVEPITNLRRDSHYLAPSFSAISPDLWSDVASIVRNLCLNWILLVPPMILAVLATKILGYLFTDALRYFVDVSWIIPGLIVAMLCFIASLSFAAANRPSRALTNGSQKQFLIFDLAIFLVGAGLLIFVLASPAGLNLTTQAANWLASRIFDIDPKWRVLIVLERGAVLGFAAYLVSWFVAPLWKKILGQASQQDANLRIWHKWIDLGAWLAAGAVFGASIAAGYLILTWMFASPPAPQTTDQIFKQISEIAAFVGVCGIPWLLASRIVADVFFITFAEFIPGADAGLEYQARSGGIFTLAQIGWLIWFSLVYSASWVGPEVSGKVATSLAATGGITGAISVIIGFSSETVAIVQKTAGIRQYLNLNTLAAIAAALFAAVLVVALSIAIDWAFGAGAYASDANPPLWTHVGVAVALLVVIITAASMVININRYSLHSMYRNRLVRAFLGASRSEQNRAITKNQFTDFDSLDSPRLYQLWPHGVEPRGDNWKPLHIINAALNLVSSKNLAWQERMAAPFTFSPLHCGCGSSAFPDGAYRTSYPSGDRKPYGDKLGLTLGTAMAISGAAVSPNMGYNSSPGVAFLMTLFNVRLGWWIGNPRSDNPHYWRTKPRVALRPFFMEMFGLTSETERWVYLSDGGHFENIGLYEMVRRRCRVIVVSDAGCDPEYEFADLGNALRKIWIDLGVQIDLGGLDRLKKRFKERPTPAEQEPYWAVGRIRYRDADGSGSDGLLLYLKSGLHGTESMDVLSYAMTHSTFPHESTANQFFTESQFESYRMLGFEITERALKAGAYTPPAAAARATQHEAVAPASPPDLTLYGVIERLETQLKRGDQPTDPAAHCGRAANSPAASAT
jgi:hypothetical protein